MTKKFGFLRFVAGLYKALGIIVLIIGILLALGILVLGIAGGSALEDAASQFGMYDMMTVSGVLGGIFGAAVTLVTTVLAAICQFAISEAILVFLAIEENTRATAHLLSSKE